jgi:hypothetical protein
MSRQSFYDNQAVDREDLNLALDNCEEDVRDVAKEASGYGITGGMSVISVGGQLRIGVNSGTVIDKTGRRCSFTGLHYEDITPTVGAGQEQWISVFAKINLKLTDYETDPTGGVEDITNYTVQTPIINPNTAAADPPNDVNADQELYVVHGDVAAIGSAVRPDLDSEAILICDLNAQYGQTDYTGVNTIDCRRTELFRRVEPDESFVTSQGTSSYQLVRSIRRAGVITREYVTQNGGKVLTINAEAIASNVKGGEYQWKADNYANHSVLFSFAGLGYGGMGGTWDGLLKAYGVQGGTLSAPWEFAAWGSPLIETP